jgi:hypothetical protein
MQNNFGISPRPELVAGSFQTRAKLLKVVNFSIENDPHRLVFIAHGIASTRRQINNGKTAVPESNVPLGPDAIIVGSPVPDRIRHGPDLLRIDRMLWIEMDLTYNAAHG